SAAASVRRSPTSSSSATSSPWSPWPASSSATRSSTSSAARSSSTKSNAQHAPRSPPPTARPPAAALCLTTPPRHRAPATTVARAKDLHDAPLDERVAVEQQLWDRVRDETFADKSLLNLTYPTYEAFFTAYPEYRHVHAWFGPSIQGKRILEVG